MGIKLRSSIKKVKGGFITKLKPKEAVVINDNIFIFFEKAKGDEGNVKGIITICAPDDVSIRKVVV